MKSDAVKSDAVPRVGVIDALSQGLNQTRRRPWLLLIPIAIDLVLWLAPRVSVSPLLQQLLRGWELLLRTTYSPAQLTTMNEMLISIRDAVGQVGGQLNLAEALTGGWLGMPSVLSGSQVTRMTFISDLVLAPAGLTVELPRIATAPFAGGTMEIGQWGMLLLAVAGLWLGGQLLAALYLRWVASSWLCENCWSGARGLLGLALQLAGFSIVVAAAITLLRLPLAFALTLLMLSSNPGLGVLAMMVGGLALWLTLWFLTALFFVIEAILLEHQNVWRSLVRSAQLVHRNFSAAMSLALVINVLVLGFRVVWGLIGDTSVGTVLAIVGNAYLSTSMLLASFAFYADLRKRAVATEPRSARPI